MVPMMSMKKMFFSSPEVTSRVDKATRKVLSKFGAFVRQRAKTSMPVRIKISQPGDPPHSHTRLLRKNIFFGYDIWRRGVVIGPILLPGRGDTGALPALEKGGISQDTKRFQGKPGRPTYIRARPFMLPAFEKEKPWLMELWRDSVVP